MSLSSMSKSERTSQHILEQVAPVFNKKGYCGTSMADITVATGLTKGAIYGNFESKEKLALAAFNYQFKKITRKLNAYVMEQDNPLDKLQAITNYYRSYYAYIIEYGGCPIVNISVDTNHQNAMLFERVKQVMERMIGKIAAIIEMGKEGGQIREEIDSLSYAELIFAQIEGSIFMSVMAKSPKTLNNMLDHVDRMIEREIKS
jgi:TetR/AcrR family transcriptional repressor of nem operon